MFEVVYEYYTIPTDPEEQHLSFKQTGTTAIVLFGYQYLATFWSILLTKPMFWL